MHVPFSRLVYRTSLLPFYLGLLVPIAIVFGWSTSLLFLPLALVYVIYAPVLYVTYIRRKLTRIELKDFKFVYAFTLVATLLELVPQSVNAIYSSGIINTLDNTLIITVTVLLFLSEMQFTDLYDLGSSIKNIGKWKDSLVEVYSQTKSLMIVFGIIVLLSAIGSILLSSYSSNLTSQLIASAMMNPQNTIYSYALTVFAVYTTILIFGVVLYVSDDISMIRMKKFKTA